MVQYLNKIRGKIALSQLIAREDEKKRIQNYCEWKYIEIENERGNSRAENHASKVHKSGRRHNMKKIWKFSIFHTRKYISPKGQKHEAIVRKKWNIHDATRAGASENDKRKSTKHDSYYMFLLWVLGVYHFFLSFFSFTCELLSGLTAFGIPCTIVIPPTHNQIHTQAVCMFVWCAWAHLTLAIYGYKNDAIKYHWIACIDVRRGANMMKYGYVFRTIWKWSKIETK